MFEMCNAGALKIYKKTNFLNKNTQHKDQKILSKRICRQIDRLLYKLVISKLDSSGFTGIELHEWVKRHSRRSMPITRVSQPSKYSN